MAYLSQKLNLIRFVNDRKIWIIFCNYIDNIQNKAYNPFSITKYCFYLYHTGIDTVYSVFSNSISSFHLSHTGLDTLPLYSSLCFSVLLDLFLYLSHTGIDTRIPIFLGFNSFNILLPFPYGNWYLAKSRKIGSMRWVFYLSHTGIDTFIKKPCSLNCEQGLTIIKYIF